MTTKSASKPKTTKTRKPKTTKTSKAPAAQTKDVNSNGKRTEGGVFTVPLSALTADPINPRKDREDPCPMLCASIASKGLLQNLGIRRPDETDSTYYVTYGRRRLTALKALAKAGTIPETYPVPCRMAEGDDAEIFDAQIAENICRKAMHPMDEFEAFYHLHTLGWDADRIASHYGTTARVIKDRLALGGAAESIRQSYRDGYISLEIVKSYAGCPDTARQERVFRDLFGSPDRTNTHAVHRALYQSAVDSEDDLARFVGLDAYEAAGGSIERDLLSDEVRLTDIDLLARLRDDAMRKAVDELLGQGWKWAEASDQPIHALRRGMRRIEGTAVEKTEAEKSRLLELEAKLEELENAHLAEAVLEFEAFSAEYDALCSVEYTFTAEEKAISGCFAVLEGDTLFIYSAFVRPQDEPKPEVQTEAERVVTIADMARADDATDTAAPQLAATQTTAATGIANRHDRNMETNLANYRALTLRALLIERPETACRLAEFNLCAQIFNDAQPDFFGSEMMVHEPVLSTTSRDLDHMPAMARIEAARDALRTDVFDHESFRDGFAAFLALERNEREALIAFAYASTLSESADNAGGLEDLATTWDVEYRDYYTPTSANYFSKVSKPVLLEALDECLGRNTRLQFVANNARKSDVVDTITDIFDGKRTISEEAAEHARRWVPIGFRFDDMEASDT